MTAAVLSIGTELTRGELINSNAAWLGEQLTMLGFEVLEHVTVDDHRDRIVSILARLAKQVGVVVVTGGLGPTTDDLTSESVAGCLGVALVRDEASVEVMRRKFASMGREMPSSNLKQADFPAGAEILPNEIGTAPGFRVALDGCAMFFMPGVPREMQQLFRSQVTPRIGVMASPTTHQKHLRTFGLSESRLQELLADVEEQHEGVTLGYRASFPEIEVKVLARAADQMQAESLAGDVTQLVRDRLGEHVFGDRETTFPGSVGRTLRDRGETLAVAESCTGGMVGSMMTSVPGSSEYLLFDAVVYSNVAKVSVLGVSPETLRAYGAVSEETVLAMVQGTLRVSDADLALAITGIAGPGGGTDDKPVGTVWIGVGRRGETPSARHFQLPGDRERVRTLSAYLGLRLVQQLARSGRLAP